LVVGLQPVREAIRVHGCRVARVLVEKGDSGRLQALARFARDQSVPRVEEVSRAALDRLSTGVSHQGALAWAPGLVLSGLSEILGAADLAAVALDGIQDPQNFGAIIRSAVALTSAPIIWGEHSSAPLSPATFRASAGAIEHARLCRVPSLRSALQEATSRGVAVVGLDAHAETKLANVDLQRPTVLVIGNEHEGLRRGIRRSCSTLASLVQPGKVDSLNASVAAGIALYQIEIQRELSDR
jgi:23S rRNA (guanosine2251-2'-O)-methyltransferase